MTLVATSNCAPDELYKDGLQRQNFVPAIERLKQSLTVLNVDGGVDYRLRALTRVPLYLWPCDATAEQRMTQWFAAVATEPGVAGATIQVQGRPLRTRRRAEGVVWFDFTELCETARSAADYIELAAEYQAAVLSHVPQLDAEREDAARRFINLVDEFYDRGRLGYRCRPHQPARPPGARQGTGAGHAGAGRGDRPDRASDPARAEERRGGGVGGATFPQTRCGFARYSSDCISRSRDWVRLNSKRSFLPV